MVGRSVRCRQIDLSSFYPGSQWCFCYRQASKFSQWRLQSGQTSCSNTGIYWYLCPGFTPGITGQEAGIQHPSLTLFSVLSTDCARGEVVAGTTITCKRQLEEPQAGIWTQGWLYWPPCCHNNRWCGIIIIKKWVNNLWPRDARLCFMRDTDTDLDLEAIKTSIVACHNLNFTYNTFLQRNYLKISHNK